MPTTDFAIFMNEVHECCAPSNFLVLFTLVNLKPRKSIQIYLLLKEWWMERAVVNEVEICSIVIAICWCYIFCWTYIQCSTSPFVLKFVFRKLLSTCSFRKRNQLISINLHLRFFQDRYIKDYAKTFFPQKYKSWGNSSHSWCYFWIYCDIEGRVTFRFSKIKEISAQVIF